MLPNPWWIYLCEWLSNFYTQPPEFRKTFVPARQERQVQTTSTLFAQPFIMGLLQRFHSHGIWTKGTHWPQRLVIKAFHRYSKLISRYYPVYVRKKCVFPFRSQTITHLPRKWTLRFFFFIGILYFTRKCDNNWITYFLEIIILYQMTKTNC